jgi:hypothetical protein
VACSIFISDIIGFVSQFHNSCSGGIKSADGYKIYMLDLFPLFGAPTNFKEFSP